MDMVTRRTMRAGWAALAMALLWGCDPFAPSEPESPTVAGSVRAASSPSEVPTLLGRGLAGGNVLQAVAVVDPAFRGLSGSLPFSRPDFVTCLERLVKGGLDTARFSWTSTPSGASDSVSGDVDWLLVESGGGRWQGRATWGVVRGESAEWTLARWSEPGTSGDWSDACGGF